MDTLSVSPHWFYWRRNNIKSRIKKRNSIFLILITLYLPLILFKYQDFIYNDVLGSIFGLKEHLFISIPLGFLS